MIVLDFSHICLCFCTDDPLGTSASFVVVSAVSFQNLTFLSFTTGTAIELHSTQIVF